MSGKKSEARARVLRNNPWQEPGEKISPYAVTVGGSTHRTAVPQIEPSGVADYKRKMGVCMTPGCHKIAGHESDHS